MTNIGLATEQKFATMEQLEKLRWMFSPFAPNRDAITLAKVKFTYDIMNFAERGCHISPADIHAYLSEIKPMTQETYQALTHMMSVCQIIIVEEVTC